MRDFCTWCALAGHPHFVQSLTIELAMHFGLACVNIIATRRVVVYGEWVACGV